MNNFYETNCKDCKNLKNCSFALTLVNTNNFNDILITECKKYEKLEINEFTIKITSCNTCPHKRFTESDYYCSEKPCSESTWRGIKSKNINTIQSWCPKMTESIENKKAFCDGCHDNFYNGNNDMGVEECYSLKNLKLIMRKKVHINDIPPHEQEFKLYPNCYHIPKYVFFDAK